MMIVFHYAFDLYILGLAKIDVFNGGWHWFARIIQFGFLGLVGFSLHLSYRSTRYSDYRVFLGKQFKRFVIVLASAFGITVVSAFVFPGETIWFGTLHLIAFSILIGSLTIRFPYLQILSIIPVYLLGTWFANLHSVFSWLIPLGITPSTFASLDYFPLFPWMAVPMIGLSLAHFLDRRGLLSHSKNPLRIRPLERLGRHSLLIYLMHQPIVFILFWLTLSLFNLLWFLHRI